MDLEKNARIYAGIPEDSPQDLKYCVMDKKAKYDAFIAGANWQEQKMINKGAEWLRDCLDNGLWVDQFLSEKEKEAVVLTYKEDMEEK